MTWNSKTNVLLAFAVIGTITLTSLFNTPEVNTTKVLESSQPPVLASVSAVNAKTVVRLTPDPSRTVGIYGPIGMQPDGSTQAIVHKILELGRDGKPFYVDINSPGGSVIDGSMIISAIEASKGPVYTICEELCASMAALIFEYGTTRYSVDRSFLMFHPASGGAEGEVDKMVSRLGSIQRYVGKLEAHVAKRAGLSFAEYKARSGIEAWIDGEDAVNAHFADSLASVYLSSPAFSPSHAVPTEFTIPVRPNNFHIDGIIQWPTF